MNLRWPNLSLRWKLIFGSALIEIVMLTILVINNVRLIDSSLQEQVELRLREISVLLNASIAPSMAQLDYGPIQGVFSESRRRDGIVYFVLFDRNGKAVVSDGWAADMPLPAVQPAIASDNSKQRFDTAIPISIGSQTYGRLQFGISTEFLHLARDKLLRQSLAIAAIEIVLSIILLAMLGIWLTRHLARLEAASLAVARGNFDVSVRVDSHDEIARVGQAFNRMTQEIKHRLSELGNSERLLRLSQQAARMGNYSVDLTTGQWKSSPLLDATLGIDNSYAHDIAGWRSLIHPDDRQRVLEEFHAKINDGKAFSREYRIIRPSSGETRWVITWGDYEKDSTGQPVLQVGAIQDITERKQAEEKIRELAFFDQLTALPNRTLVLDRLKQAMTASGRSDSHAALLFIDLDNFKTLNDTLGHDIGDLLLKQVATRLTTCVREGDTVARVGGDEFVVILTGLGNSAMDSASATETVADKILATLNQTYQLGSSTHRSTASIGATLFKGSLTSIDDLMKQTDLTMYRAKAAGRNTFRFFDPAMELAVKERAALEEDLRRALEEHQLLLHYQPQIAGERLTGAEALVRWQHPQRGLVPPAEFIPLAEESGLILPLGHWVLETACAQLAQWATRPEMAHLTLAVNVSAHQFHLSDFVDQVLTVLHKTGANPQQLKLELTESLLVENVQDIIEKMFALKARGVSFSLDDFGTGYSSLSYLKRLPLDQLKIDQSFVRDILVDPNDAAIARTIVALAQSLGLGVIAEGVETEMQRDFLAHAGCHAYQGYFFSRPLPLTGFEAFALKMQEDKNMEYLPG